MEASITIDSKSGSVSVGDFLITSRSRTSDLSEAFSIGAEQPVLALGKPVACQFAFAEIVSNGQRVQVELRFENKALVSCFFSFPGTAPNDEHRICSRWLADQLGFGGALARFPWGSAGVATDRSGNSHVFVHNKNNSWAR
jgi:hypothetical protein